MYILGFPKSSRFISNTSVSEITSSCFSDAIFIYHTSELIPVDDIDAVAGYIDSDRFGSDGFTMQVALVTPDGRIWIPTNEAGLAARIREVVVGGLAWYQAGLSGSLLPYGGAYGDPMIPCLSFSDISFEEAKPLLVEAFNAGYKYITLDDAFILFKDNNLYAEMATPQTAEQMLEFAKESWWG